MKRREAIKNLLYGMAALSAFPTLAVLLSGNCFALCDSIQGPMVSYHWDRDKVDKKQPQNEGTGYNERHKAFGCTNFYKRLDFLYFKNSHYEDTFYIGEFFEWKQFGNFTLGTDFGLFFHGYSDKYPFIPAPLPRAKYQRGHFIVNTYLLLNAGIAMGLEYEF